MIDSETLTEWFGLTDAQLPIVEDAVERALVWVETQFGRHFHTARSFAYRFSGGPSCGPNKKTLFLPEIPLEDEAESETVFLITVEEKNSADEWETVDATDYELIIPNFAYEMPQLVHDSFWPAGHLNIRVTLTAGYVVGGLPGDIEQLVLDLVGTWWRDRGKENLGSESIDGYSYTRWTPTADSIPTTWSSTLTRWKHPVFA